MSLDYVRRTYEHLGRTDPLYAVLTHREFRGNRWDPEAFFRTGEQEVQELFDDLGQLRRNPSRGHALDFGCGVGRLSQALARRFERVTAVDISQSMLAKARELDTSGGRVDWVHNERDELAFLPSASVDFVYSNITLQHIPPPHLQRYIAEFLRVLCPGGLAVFQVPSGPRIEPGSWRAAWYAFRRTHWRRFWQRLRGRPTYEIHYLARTAVEEIVRQGDANLIDARDLGTRARNFRYTAEKNRQYGNA